MLARCFCLLATLCGAPAGRPGHRGDASSIPGFASAESARSGLRARLVTLAPSAPPRHQPDNARPNLTSPDQTFGTKAGPPRTPRAVRSAKLGGAVEALWRVALAACFAPLLNTENDHDNGCIGAQPGQRPIVYACRRCKAGPLAGPVVDAGPGRRRRGGVVCPGAPDRKSCISGTR